MKALDFRLLNQGNIELCGWYATQNGNQVKGWEVAIMNTVEILCHWTSRHFAVGSEVESSYSVSG